MLIPPICHNDRESGYSAIVMVMILLLLGMLLLNGFNAQLMIAHQTEIDQRQYLRAYNHAASALAWGAQQTWPAPVEQWQCKTQPTYQLTACLKSGKQSGQGILTGESDIGIALFYIVTFADGIVQKPQMTTGNWLDFCPINEGGFCERQ